MISDLINKTFPMKSINKERNSYSSNTIGSKAFIFLNLNP